MSELNVKEMNFDQLFKRISPEEIIDNVFTLGFTVITAGKEDHYNSMIGSGGGFGLLFRKPTTWLTLPPQNVSLSELL